MKPTFLEYDKPLLTVMVQADNPERIKELMDKSLEEGAQAFGMQFCRMKPEYRSRKIYNELFSYAKNKPVYVTNYRSAKNEGKTDEQLAQELMELAECGATLCDVMGDIFDKSPYELTVRKSAVEKQTVLIDALHQRGAQVLMSSHIHEYVPAQKVIEIAMEHQRRGADICKIVIHAETMEQQLECLKTINLLKQKLEIPFLFLCGGECRILRRIGGEIGSCMYLCVYEYDELATPAQPILKHLKAVIDNINL